MVAFMVLLLFIGNRFLGTSEDDLVMNILSKYNNDDAVILDLEWRLNKNLFLKNNNDLIAIWKAIYWSRGIIIDCSEFFFGYATE